MIHHVNKGLIMILILFKWEPDRAQCSTYKVKQVFAQEKEKKSHSMKDI